MPNKFEYKGSILVKIAVLFCNVSDIMKIWLWICGIIESSIFNNDHSSPSGFVEANLNIKEANINDNKPNEIDAFF